METNRNYVGSKGPIEGPTKKQDWCARCEKLNVDHLGECPFEKEDWRKGCGHASQRCIMCGECIEKLLSTQEEMIRKEERERCAKIATKTIIKHRGTHPVWDTLKKEMLELLNNL